MLLLLSVDNAVVISTIANKAKPEDGNKVIKYGIVGAFLFRGLALCGVGWLMNNPEVGGLAKVLGGIYLVRMGYGPYGISVPSHSRNHDMRLTQFAPSIGTVPRTSVEHT